MADTGSVLLAIVFVYLKRVSSRGAAATCMCLETKSDLNAPHPPRLAVVADVAYIHARRPSDFSKEFICRGQVSTIQIRH